MRVHTHLSGHTYVMSALGRSVNPSANQVANEKYLDERRVLTGCCQLHASHTAWKDRSQACEQSVVSKAHGIADSPSLLS